MAWWAKPPVRFNKCEPTIQACRPRINHVGLRCNQCGPEALHRINECGPGRCSIASRTLFHCKPQQVATRHIS
jgi:hypothetical protein